MSEFPQTLATREKYARDERERQQAMAESVPLRRA